MKATMHKISWIIFAALSHGTLCLATQTAQPIENSTQYETPHFSIVSAQLSQQLRDFSAKTLPKCQSYQHHVLGLLCAYTTCLSTAHAVITDNIKKPFKNADITTIIPIRAITKALTASTDIKYITHALMETGPLRRSINNTVQKAIRNSHKQGSLIARETILQTAERTTLDTLNQNFKTLLSESYGSYLKHSRTHIWDMRKAISNFDVWAKQHFEPLTHDQKLLVDPILTELRHLRAQHHSKCMIM